MLNKLWSWFKSLFKSQDPEKFGHEAIDIIKPKPFKYRTVKNTKGAFGKRKPYKFNNMKVVRRSERSVKD